MARDNQIISGSNPGVQLGVAYNQAIAGYTAFNAIAASGSGLIYNQDIPNQTLARQSSGLYNNCWQQRTGWPDNANHSFCKMFRAYYNGNVSPATATQPTSNSMTSTPDQYNNSTTAGTYYGVGLWYTRSRYYFGVQVNEPTYGTCKIASPWFVGPAGGGRDYYLTSLNSLSGTISGFRNGNVGVGSTNTYNSGAVSPDYMTLIATASYPKVFAGWRSNGAAGTVLSTSASFNLYYTNVNMRALTVLWCMFKVN